jgi:hypothetical protein
MLYKDDCIAKAVTFLRMSLTVGMMRCIESNTERNLMRIHFKIKTLMRTALFWVITRRVVVTSYRRFGTTCRPFFGFLTLENGADRLSRNGSLYLHAL